MNTTFLPLSSSNFLRKCTKNLISAPTSFVFSYLNGLDSVFCDIYKYLDKFFEAEASSCYCRSENKSEIINGGYNEKTGISETLLVRQKKLKEMIDLLQFVEKLLNKNKGFEVAYDNFKNQKKVCVHRLRNRCCDRGCDSSIISWMKTHDPKLHVEVKESSSSKDHYEAHYLDACFFCGKSLHNSDIFMYRGDTPFCSIECRQKQMDIDEAREKKLRFDRSLRKPNSKSYTSNIIVPMRIVTVSS